MELAISVWFTIVEYGKNKYTHRYTLTLKIRLYHDSSRAYYGLKSNLMTTFV